MTIPIVSAQVVLNCTELQPTLDYFLDQLGFRMLRISPADDPREAHIEGHGLNILLQRTTGDTTVPMAHGLLRLPGSAEASGHRVAPNGTRIEYVPHLPQLEEPPLQEELVISRLAERSGDSTAWITGRAGMQYRDLIPGRLGGRFIASHIRISTGGPVPDHVHHHFVRFQMIFCVRGWVRVVYEDQGPPILLEAGDCFLQPPHIRHRVLESSDGLEVVEIASPAEHDTLLDHTMTLPTPDYRPGHVFSGQRFVFHDSSEAPWQDSSTPGIEIQDTGLAAGTDQLLDARVLRVAHGASGTTGGAVLDLFHTGEFRFLFVLRGAVALNGEGLAEAPLGTGDSLTLPAGRHCQLTFKKEDSACLLVTCPERTSPRT